MSYKVRRGDTLRRVARRFGIKEVDGIREMNGLSSRQDLRAGRTIRLPLPEKWSPKFYSTQD